MKPTESPVSEEAREQVTPSQAAPLPTEAPAAEEPQFDAPSSEAPPPKSFRLTPRKILLLALGVILLVVFSGWITERRRAGSADYVDGRLSAKPIGEPAPEFTLKSIDGQRIKLSDYRGRTVIVAFWASWCAPCLIEMPTLVDYYRSRGANVEMLAVSMDDDIEDAKGYANHNHLPFPVLFDSKGQVADAYAVEGIPSLYVVDPSGIVRDHHEGLISSLEDVLANDVAISQGRTPPILPLVRDR